MGCARTGGELHGHPALDDLLHVPVDVLNSGLLGPEFDILSCSLGFGLEEVLGPKDLLEPRRK